MTFQYPYALYLDSKIIGTLRQLLGFFRNGVFLRDNTIIYLKKYKETYRSFKKILDAEQIPYRFMKPMELDQLSGQIIFYAFNAQSNCRLVANRQLKHVFITHGESNKISSIKPIIRIYDHVVMAGKLSLERYYKSGVFDTHDYETGRLILMGDTFIGQTGFGQSDSATPTLFYAPTWEGGLLSENYSSLQNITLVNESIQEVVNQSQINRIVIQPHPNLGHRDKKYLKYLILLIKSLASSNIQVYLQRNYITLSLSQIISLKKANTIFIGIEELKNFSAQYALIDISAIESQCINELIPYITFYDESKLRRDIPSLYLERYKQLGVELDQKNISLNIHKMAQNLSYLRDILFCSSHYITNIKNPLSKRIDLLKEIM